MESFKKKCHSLLFGSEISPNRKVYLDYLRVIATFFVIGTHTVALAILEVETSGVLKNSLEFINMLFLSCNLLFILISGGLLLPVQNEGIVSFYAKRFLRVLIPLVVYYVLYVTAQEGFYWISPKMWPSFLLRILSGAPVEAPHFWLIYVILGLYIITPFIRYLLGCLSEKALRFLIVLVFLWNAFDTYAPMFGIISPAPIAYVTDTFLGVFLLGYFLAEHTNEKMEKFFLAMGVLSLGISLFMICSMDSFADYIYNNAPTMMFVSGEIFVLVKRICADLHTEPLWVRCIGKYSFSILLIHWGVLHVAVKKLLHVNVMSGGIIGGCLLMFILTLIISVIGAVLIDQTIIAFLLKLIQKLITVLNPKKTHKH